MPTTWAGSTFYRPYDSAISAANLSVAIRPLGDGNLPNLLMYGVMTRNPASIEAGL